MSQSPPSQRDVTQWIHWAREVLDLTRALPPFRSRRPNPQGFNPAEVAEQYGSSLWVWNWSDRKITQRIDLGDKGLLPLEVGEGRRGG